jgi:hypothetical protein
MDERRRGNVKWKWLEMSRRQEGFSRSKAPDVSIARGGIEVIQPVFVLCGLCPSIEYVRSMRHFGGRWYGIFEYVLYWYRVGCHCCCVLS